MRSPALNLYYTKPWAIMALATFTKPAMFAPVQNRKSVKKKSAAADFFRIIEKTHSPRDWRVAARAGACVEFILHQSLRNHSVGYFYETGDVCACNVIYPITFFCAELDCCVVSVCVDVYHDAVELFVNFFRRP